MDLESNLEQDVRRILTQKGPGIYIAELLPGLILDPKGIVRSDESDRSEGTRIQGRYSGCQTKEGYSLELPNAIIIIPYEAARLSFISGPSHVSSNTKPIEPCREVVVKADEAYL